ncbi:MAG TPA: rRNA maturation RNase YbeY [Candidatus Moranbacteria bacterium]|nr:rRNA maturation RNase YbeY [Candidatus Moranbacteria bacterium]HAT74947.1 rRNA maturation RNase YbeY [Candidatus Moranbacteria bacterium]
MPLKIEINNIAKSPVEKSLIKIAAIKALEKSEYDYLIKKNIFVSFALVGEEEMKKINKKYREKNRATDILSFCEYEEVDLLKNITKKDLFLGELVLCYDYIKRECADEKDLRKELARIIAHGVLHLLCYEHSKKMFDIQNAVADSG